MRRLIRGLFRRIRNCWWHFITKLRIKHVGKSSTIIRPMTIFNGRYIRMGKKSYILSGARLEAIDKWNNQTFTPEMIIGNNVAIQQNIHITCAGKLLIGDGTSVLGGTITDIVHEYDDISLPPHQQNIHVIPVKIGKQCMIGMGARIMPGASLGDHVIIGTNAVVTQAIPDYCVAVGVPAKVIKRYDFDLKKWVKV